MAWIEICKTPAGTVYRVRDRDAITNKKVTLWSGHGSAMATAIWKKIEMAAAKKRNLEMQARVKKFMGGE